MIIRNELPQRASDEQLQLISFLAPQHAVARMIVIRRSSENHQAPGFSTTPIGIHTFPFAWSKGFPQTVNDKGRYHSQGRQGRGPPQLRYGPSDPSLGLDHMFA
jgi:hypothetical protein